MVNILRLDLGCGKRKKVGFVGVDISSDCEADVIWDLRTAPWPWPDNSIEEIYSGHFFEHLNGRERITFMEELWRILIPNGKALITTPYWASWRAVADPTHIFPPIVEQSYLYFNRDWRIANKLEHYPIHCNFDFECQHVYNPDVGFPDDSTRDQGTKHYLNVVDDLNCLLIKRD